MYVLYLQGGNWSISYASVTVFSHYAEYFSSLGLTVYSPLGLDATVLKICLEMLVIFTLCE